MSEHASTAQPTGHEEELAHVAEPKVLIGTFLALIFLTILTVAVATVGFGEWDFLFAMVIASIKALLVCLYFMHLRYDKPFHALVFISGLAFALLFIGFSYMDSYQYQGDLEVKNTVDYKDAPALYDHGDEGHGDEGH